MTKPGEVLSDTRHPLSNGDELRIVFTAPRSPLEVELRIVVVPRIEPWAIPAPEVDPFTRPPLATIDLAPHLGRLVKAGLEAIVAQLAKGEPPAVEPPEQAPTLDPAGQTGSEPWE